MGKFVMFRHALLPRLLLRCLLVCGLCSKGHAADPATPCDGPQPATKCGSTQDFMFVIDNSWSMTITYGITPEQVKEFLRAFVHELDFSAAPNAPRVGITTFNGKMVTTGDWDVEWFGKLDRARFAIVMPCEAFWESEQCPKELEKVLKNLPEHRVFLLRVDDTFRGQAPAGNFLGESEEQ